MTPDTLKDLRTMAIRGEVYNGNTLALTLLDEIDRLNRDLTLTRLEVEAAWDAYDDIKENR